MNRYRKHGHYYETSANCLLPNLTQFLPRGAGAMLLILSGLSGVLKTTSAEDSKTPLHEAVAGIENSTVLPALLKAGADRKARHKAGKTFGTTRRTTRPTKSGEVHLHGQASAFFHHVLLSEPYLQSP